MSRRTGEQTSSPPCPSPGGARTQAGRAEAGDVSAQKQIAQECLWKLTISAGELGVR